MCHSHEPGSQRFARHCSCLFPTTGPLQSHLSIYDLGKFAAKAIVDLGSKIQFASFCMFDVSHILLLFLLRPKGLFHLEHSVLKSRVCRTRAANFSTRVNVQSERKPAKRV